MKSLFKDISFSLALVIAIFFSFIGAVGAFAGVGSFITHGDIILSARIRLIELGISLAMLLVAGLLYMFVLRLSPQMNSKNA
jgi:phosphate/sulfate permease